MMSLFRTYEQICASHFVKIIQKKKICERMVICWNMDLDLLFQ